jgi:glucose-1-phosphate adenylyltransferase
MNSATKDVLTLVMAGGKGSRLDPLTAERAKPAVPFGGAYRIIDFTLSNCLNSDLRQILILTQYKSRSLDQHVNLAWRFFIRQLQEFIEVLPPQMRIGEDWYQGTADAVYQNVYSIEQHKCEHVLILSGDHIYQMDYREMLDTHVSSGAEATIACIPVPLDEATEFGVMSVDDAGRIVEFKEKPAQPQHMPNDPNRALASMGVYIFKRDFLLDQLCQDALDQDSSRDFGKNIIPSIIQSHHVQSFPFVDTQTGEAEYWRDVGTLDAYYEANMDLVQPTPGFNMYDPNWPIRTYSPSLPPPKFVFNDDATDKLPARRGYAVDSVISSGCVLSGGYVVNSMLSPSVRVNSYARVEDSIILSGAEIGKRALVRRAIIDKGVVIPEGMEVGVNSDDDIARGFTRTESGLTVVPHMWAFAQDGGTI